MRLIYFSPVPYVSYSQRPHFMMRYMLKHGVESALWVEPYPTRLPRLGDIQRRPAVRKDCAVPDKGIIVRPVPTWPIEPLPGGSMVNTTFRWQEVKAQLLDFAGRGDCLVGVGRPSALAVWALDNLPYKASFFDAMDDFPAFYGGLSAFSMTRRETQIASRVDRVFCSSHPLQEKFLAQGSKAELLLNGYEMSRLPDPCPQETREYIGYVGTIGTWFDWPLVVEMANALPDVPFRLIGPEFVPRPRHLPSNIEILPECSQPEAVAYVREFHIGLIPFLINRLTRCVDPIKYYEYRALGVPVWSTDFGEMVRRGECDGVTKINRQSHFRSLYSGGMDSIMSQFEVASFRAKNDWAERFGLMLS